MKLVSQSFLVFFCGFLCSFSAQAQDGFAIAPKPDLGIAPGGTAVRNFPAIQSSIATSEVLDSKMFDFIHGILASGRKGEKLKCRVEVRATKTNRKFSTGTQFVELLQIELFTDHFGPRSIKFAFPVGAKFGRRIINNEDYGPVEEIKIFTDEPNENWFQFQHDGTRIVWAEIGSMYQFAPCLKKRD